MIDITNWSYSDFRDYDLLPRPTFSSARIRYFNYNSSFVYLYFCDYVLVIHTVHMYVCTLCFLTLYRRYDTGKTYYWQRQKELDTWARAFREPPLRNWLKTDNSVRDNVTFSHFIPLDAATWHSCSLSRCAGRIGSWQQKQNKIRDRPHGGMTSGTLSEMHLTPFHAVTYAQKGVWRCRPAISCGNSQKRWGPHI